MFIYHILVERLESWGWIIEIFCSIILSMWMLNNQVLLIWLSKSIQFATGAQIFEVYILPNL